MHQSKVLPLKKHPISVTIASIVVGILASTPVLATTSTITSSPTLSVIGHAPTVTVSSAGQITVADTNNNGIVDTGDILTIDNTKLSLSDPDTDAPDTHTPYTYSWKSGAKEVSTTGTYTIANTDLGKSITLKVIGHTDAATTDPAMSPEVDAKYINDAKLNITGTPTSIKVADADEPAGVTIAGLDSSGRPVVGTQLTANVTCLGSCSATKLKYQWQIESTANSGTYSDISNATIQKYTPVKGDQKKRIQVVVTK